MKGLSCVLLAVALIHAGSALAQAPAPTADDVIRDGRGNYRPTTPTEALNPACPNAGGSGRSAPGVVGATYNGTVCPPAGGPAPVEDPNNASILGEQPMTVGVPDPNGPGRSVKANCSGVGNIAVTYADGSTGVWMVSTTGTHILGAEISEVNSAGTTATCSYGNLR